MPTTSRITLDDLETMRDLQVAVDTLTAAIRGRYLPLAEQLSQAAVPGAEFLMVELSEAITKRGDGTLELLTGSVERFLESNRTQRDVRGALRASYATWPVAADVRGPERGRFRGRLVDDVGEWWHCEHRHTWGSAATRCAREHLVQPG